MSPKLIAITSVSCVVGIVVVSAAITFFWPGTRGSVSHIEKLGGSVVFDTGWGETVCEMVYLNDTNATDSDLTHVRDLKPCHGVYLKNTNITDKGLKQLNGLSLHEIDLTGTKVTSAGIEELRQTIPNENCQIEFHP